MLTERDAVRLRFQSRAQIFDFVAYNCERAVDQFDVALIDIGVVADIGLLVLRAFTFAVIDAFRLCLLTGGGRFERRAAIVDHLARAGQKGHPVPALSGVLKPVDDPGLRLAGIRG